MYFSHQRLLLLHCPRQLPANLSASLLLSLIMLPALRNNQGATADQNNKYKGSSKCNASYLRRQSDLCTYLLYRVILFKIGLVPRSDGTHEQFQQYNRVGIMKSTKKFWPWRRKNEKVVKMFKMMLLYQHTHVIMYHIA